MTDVFTIQGIRYRQSECPECGCLHLVNAHFYDSQYRTAGSVFCPNGHKSGWSETENDRLRREGHRLKQQIAQKDSEIKDWIATANDQKKKVDAARRETAKLKKRVASGTCPCCGRTFQNLQRHMKAKHPDIIDAKDVAKVHSKITKRGKNVVELKQA